MHRGAQYRYLLAVSLAAALTAASALAQSPTTVPTLPATSPTPVQPATPLPPPVTISPQLIIGRWRHTRTDSETRTSDTLIIEFMADGRYQARNRHSLFPTPERPNEGRYAIGNIGQGGFDLRIERHLVDPESDPREAVEVQRITVVDPDTLQAADGSVVRRVRE